MKKLLVCLAVFLSTAFLAVPVPALAATVSRVSASSSSASDWSFLTHWHYWAMQGNYEVNFVCSTGCPTINHPFSITSQDRYGNLAGSGTLPSNSGYTWDVTGKVTGNALTLHLAYTGLNAGYFIDFVGNVNPDGSLSGTAVDKDTPAFGNTYTWQTVTSSAVQKEVNLIVWCKLVMLVTGSSQCL